MFPEGYFSFRKHAFKRYRSIIKQLDVEQHFKMKELIKNRAF